jgi:hypothetical protein
MQHFSQTPQSAPAPSPEARSKYTLPRNPNNAIQEMMSTIDLLRSALIEETEALNDADTKTFMTLQDKKINIARDYMDGITQLIARKEEMKKADPKLIQRLENMRVEFSDTTHNNHAALSRMSNGMKRLGTRIMETAREAAKREEQLIYGASGQMQSGSKATIGVNRSA